MLVLAAAVAVGIMAPVGTAAAASTPTKASTSSSASAGSTTKKASSTAASTTKKTVTRPSAPVKAKHAAGLAPAAARQARAAAAHSAISTATVPDTCSGQISPDTVYPCSTPSGTGTDTFTLTLADTTDLVQIRALSTTGNTLGVTVTAPGGTALTCQNTDLVQCATSASGTYTVQVQSQSSDYTLDYTALLSDSSCAAADPSFATPVLQGSLAAGETGACYTLNMTSGHVLHAYTASSQYGELNATVYDATGTQICIDDQGDCTLTGTAPYRVRVGDLYGHADDYWLTLNDITDPQGCQTAAQQIYGSVPDTSSGDECRTLTVATAGSYQIYSVTSLSGGIGGSLYNPDGTGACMGTNSSSNCQLAAGTYDFVALEYPEYMTTFGVVFIAANETRGCTATGDTDFASGPATGTFAGLGEEVCLTLPTAAGASAYVFNQPDAGGTTPSVQVLDATGASTCSIAYAYVTCALTGTAPFHEILSAQSAGGGYRLLTQRTDSTSGCNVWPQSGFGGSWGAQVKLTASSDVSCLSIPAAQHSTGEMIDYSNLANSVDGAIYVNNPAGGQVCVGTTTAVCSYTSGVDYTALVITTSSTGDTYDLVRRDVSQTAKCSAPASTTVGGQSSALVLNSDLDAACYHVTAATTDKWWFDVRTLAPGTAGAVLEVAGPTGSIVCRQWGESCNVTGSTAYQVIVISSNYAGINIAGHVDAWKVGTSSGWASQCTAHQFTAADGWAPLSATLTESSSAYCAEVAVKPIQDFAVYGTTNASGLNLPWLSMYVASDWTNGIGLCGGINYGQFGFNCGTNQISAADEAVMVVTPSSAPTPVGFTIQGVCSTGCATPPPAATISSITPATGVAGVDKVVISGTNLTLGTKVALASNGIAVDSNSSPVSINAAGTALTTDLITTGLTPGKYDIVLNGVGYTTGTPSQGYLPGAFTVTAAPTVPNSTFTPVNTVRILDTRKGLGAAKARVAAFSGITLKVAGVGGVPATGATAVLVNITAVSPANGGNLEVYPDSESRPGTSTVNFGTGQTVANLAVVPLVDGKIDLYNDSPGLVDILADVSGYYTTASSGSLLTTVTPTAILDTRSGLGAPKAKVGAEGTVVLPVSGAGGVPADGATAVLVDVTAINPTASGNLEVYPDTLTAPGSSTLNFTPGTTISNEAVVRLIDGKIDVHNDTPGTTDVTVNVLGYFSATGSAFQPENTVRVLDTRTGLGGSGETVIPGGAAVLNVMDLPGVPPTITAVVLNVTVTGTPSAGSMTVFPDGTATPAVPDYSWATGNTVAGLVTVPVVNGKVDFYNSSSGTIQVIADLAGYYHS
ncbi:MAG TPA: hypothetical protein VFN97_06235 [Actinospica sp.]|nr:hypothetical protein [Actinospica sp.]